MHLEILIEDSSGERFLETVLPAIIGQQGNPHTWRTFAYKGIGRIPKGLTEKVDPAKRILLDNLPRLLRGYGRTPGIDAVVVVVDSDDRDCVEFLEQLHEVARACKPLPTTLFRLAIEELEAWYLGDREAVLRAYPRAKTSELDDYVQDSSCGTWERLADAVCPGGSAAVKKAPWFRQGELKHEWAERITPLMDPERNVSCSFGKLRDGLRLLVGKES